jgi:hypothetical protein
MLVGSAHPTVMADFLQEDWKFLDPQNVAVFTTMAVISNTSPILYVCHDDGEWQFHTGMDINVEDAKVVALSEIVKRDLSILDLADLPMGWIATRQSQTDAWQRFKDVRTTANAIGDENQSGC